MRFLSNTVGCARLVCRARSRADIRRDGHSIHRARRRAERRPRSRLRPDQRHLREFDPRLRSVCRWHAGSGGALPHVGPRGHRSRRPDRPALVADLADVRPSPQAAVRRQRRKRHHLRVRRSPHPPAPVAGGRLRRAFPHQRRDPPSLVYVLNAGDEGSISGFRRNANDRLAAIPGSVRSLDLGGTTPPRSGARRLR